MVGLSSYGFSLGRISLGAFRMANLTLASWVLATQLACTLPDYTRYAPKVRQREPQVVVGRQLSVRASWDNASLSAPRIIKPTPDETIRLTMNALHGQAASPRVFRPNFDAFDQLVRGSFATVEAKNNTYYHLPMIVDLNRGPVTLVDDSTRTLAPELRHGWTALDVPEHRLMRPNRKIVTFSGLDPEEEVRLMAPTVDEMIYIMRQRDPKIRTLVPVFEFVVTRMNEMQRLLEEVHANTKRKASTHRKAIMYLEDIRGHVIWDVVKTTGALILRALGISFAGG
jgi:hypothetical protein